MTTEDRRRRERELLEAAHRSIAELRVHGRTPVRIRLHPLDAEAIVTAQNSAYDGRKLRRLLDLDVVQDPMARLGEPVAEWEPEVSSE